MSVKNLGFIRGAAAVPTMKVANTKYNTEKIIDLIQDCEKRKIGIVVFPALAITGASCGDLFYQPHLYESQLDGLLKICKATEDLHVCAIIGCYIRVESRFHACAALLQNGEVKGVVPQALPDCDHRRWFSGFTQWENAPTNISLWGTDVPFGNLIFEDAHSGLSMAIDLCMDQSLPISMGAQYALKGTQLILCPAASSETAGRGDYRRQLVSVESAKTNCGYLYASAGVHESTTDMVFGGQSLIAENGKMLEEGDRFVRSGGIIYSDMDFQKIQFMQSRNEALQQPCAFRVQRVQLSLVSLIGSGDQLVRRVQKNPFICDNKNEVRRRCSEIFQIQAAGLAKRLEHAHADKCVVGISGGLDSTLALLVCAYTQQLLGRPSHDIVAVTMPGFGTTNQTYHNAMTIMKLLGTDIREISIQDAVLQHFKDIGHDPDQHDVTYENAQARERTQILMDVANSENGLLIGTGDLSEMALGWCTYNGDHMSMYSVNAGVPKTLIQYIIQWFIEEQLNGTNPQLAQTLQDIVDTPISPELLPPDETGNIAQKTESSVGPYILHDFFIYHTIAGGASPDKLLFLAQNAFADAYDEAFIKKWLHTFYRRFFVQQFKRSCMPDGPKVGTIGFSPRGDWSMPSDADVEVWLDNSL